MCTLSIWIHSHKKNWVIVAQSHFTTRKMLAVLNVNAMCELVCVSAMATSPDCQFLFCSTTPQVRSYHFIVNIVTISHIDQEMHSLHRKYTTLVQHKCIFLVGALAATL